MFFFGSCPSFPLFCVPVSLCIMFCSPLVSHPSLSLPNVIFFLSIIWICQCSCSSLFFIYLSLLTLSIIFIYCPRLFSSICCHCSVFHPLFFICPSPYLSSIALFCVPASFCPVSQPRSVPYPSLHLFHVTLPSYSVYPSICPIFLDPFVPRRDMSTPPHVTTSV